MKSQNISQNIQAIIDNYCKDNVKLEINIIVLTDLDFFSAHFVKDLFSNFFF